MPGRRPSSPDRGLARRVQVQRHRRAFQCPTTTSIWRPLTVPRLASRGTSLISRTDNLDCPPPLTSSGRVPTRSQSPAVLSTLNLASQTMECSSGTARGQPCIGSINAFSSGRQFASSFLMAPGHAGKRFPRRRHYPVPRRRGTYPWKSAGPASRSEPRATPGPLSSAGIRLPASP